MDASDAAPMNLEKEEVEVSTALEKKEVEGDDEVSTAPGKEEVDEDDEEVSSKGMFSCDSLGFEVWVDDEGETNWRRMVSRTKRLSGWLVK